MPPYDNRNPNYRNPKKKSPPVRIRSSRDLDYARAAMRSGELSHEEYNELGGAIQDVIDEARD